jgi:hypothetical protein
MEVNTESTILLMDVRDKYIFSRGIVKFVSVCNPSKLLIVGLVVAWTHCEDCFEATGGVLKKILELQNLKIFADARK